MNFYVTSCKTGGACHGAVKNLILDYIPCVAGHRVTDLREAEAAILVYDERAFDIDLFELDKLERAAKPIIVFDFFEPKFAEEVFQMRLITDDGDFPAGTAALRIFLNQTSLVKIYFKRELYSKWDEMRPFRVLPIDWPVKETPVNYGVASHAEYYKRPIDILMCWGRSHPVRSIMHAQLLAHHAELGDFAHTMTDALAMIKNGPRPNMVLINQSVWNRSTLEENYALQQQAKVTISLYGTAVKCFRCSEAPYNSLMAQQDPSLVKWAYPWVGDQNCLSLPGHATGILNVEDATRALIHRVKIRLGDLYPLYLSCVQNARMYRCQSYLEQYLLPAIEKALNCA